MASGTDILFGGLDGAPATPAPASAPTPAPAPAQPSGTDILFAPPSADTTTAKPGDIDPVTGRPYVFASTATTPVATTLGKPIVEGQQPGPITQAKIGTATDREQQRRIAAAQLFPDLSPNQAQARVFYGDDGRLAAVGEGGKPYYVEPLPVLSGGPAGERPTAAPSVAPPPSGPPPNATWEQRVQASMPPGAYGSPAYQPPPDSVSPFTPGALTGPNLLQTAGRTLPSAATVPPMIAGEALGGPLGLGAASFASDYARQFAANRFDPQAGGNPYDYGTYAKNALINAATGAAAKEATIFAATGGKAPAGVPTAQPAAAAAPPSANAAFLDNSWLRQAGDTGQGYDMTKGGTAMSSAAQQAIDAGGKVQLVADGGAKTVDITRVTNGTMYDAKNQPWGSASIAFDGTGKEGLRITQPATAATLPPAVDVAPSGGVPAGLSAQQVEQARLAQVAKDNNIPIFPQQGPGAGPFSGRVANVAQTLPFSGIPSAYRAQAENLTAAAIKETGDTSGAKALTPAVMSNGFDRVGKGMDNVLPQMNAPITTNPTALNAIQKTAADAQSDLSIVAPDSLTKAKGLIGKVLNTAQANGGVIPGADLQNMVRTGGLFDKVINGGDPYLADVAKQLKGTLIDSAQAAPGAAGDAARQWQQLRYQYKVLMALDTPAIKNPDNLLTPTSLFQAVRSSFGDKAMATGQAGTMGDLAKIGQMTKPLSSSGSAEHVALYSTLGSLGSGLMAVPYAGWGPLGIAAGSVAAAGTVGKGLDLYFRRDLANKLANPGAYTGSSIVAGGAPTMANLLRGNQSQNQLTAP